MVPVQVDILSGCVAVAVEAHAVQLAFQAGLGLAGVVRAAWQHQAHGLHDSSADLLSRLDQHDRYSLMCDVLLQIEGHIVCTSLYRNAYQTSAQTTRGQSALNRYSSVAQIFKV